MIAHSLGKDIEQRYISGPDAYRWDQVDDPSWNFSLFEYRAAVEPRTIWLIQRSDGKIKHAVYHDEETAINHYESGETALEFKEVLK